MPESAAPRHEASPLAGLAVAAVARRLGIAPATLRTWDRRYGLGPSLHTAGSHRRYSEADIARLDRMRRLMVAGVTPADAARQVLAEAAEPSPQGRSGNRGTGGPQEAAQDGPLGARHGAAGGWRESSGEPGAAPAPRAGGGNVIPMPDGGSLSRGLGRAALALDRESCTVIARDAIRRSGVVDAWDTVIRPVLVGIGRKWRDSGEGIEVEHVFSASLLSVLDEVIADSTPRLPGTVLLACAEEEQHSLPLIATAAALAERGVPIVILGARTPRETLRRSVDRLRPAGILIWSHLPDTGDLSAVDGLADYRPAPVIALAGPGWASGERSEVERPGSIGEAVTCLVRAAGG